MDMEWLWWNVLDKLQKAIEKYQQRHPEWTIDSVVKLEMGKGEEWSVPGGGTCRIPKSTPVHIEKNVWNTLVASYFLLFCLFLFCFNCHCLHCCRLFYINFKNHHFKKNKREYSKRLNTPLLKPAGKWKKWLLKIKAILPKI